MTVESLNPFVYRESKPTTFTELVLLPIIKMMLMFNLIPQVTKAQTWLNALAFRKALNRAYSTFANKYPQWVDVLFDDHFVQHTTAPLLARAWQQFTLPSPVELATLWTHQFASGSPTQDHIAELTPAVADFLHCLEAELQHHPAFSLNIHIQ